jgi:polysaccharide biosynthesis transport protein
MEPREYVHEEIDLQKYWLVLKRRWLPATGVFATVFLLVALSVLRKDPTYEAKGKILFKSSSAPLLVGLEDPRGQLKSLSQLSSPSATQAQIIRSLPVAEEAVKTLKSKNAVSSSLDPQAVANRLTVKEITGTDVIQIAYVDNDPKQAADVINQVLKAYLQSNIQSNRAEAVAVRKFIENQLPKVEEAVSQAEANLRDFKERNRIIVLQEESIKAVETLSKLGDSITEAQAQLAEVTARVSTLRGQIGLDPAQATDVSTLSQSPGVQEALKELQKAQTEFAVERTRYQPTHPKVASLQRRVDSLNALLQMRVQEVLNSQRSISIGELQAGDLKRAQIAEYLQAEVQRQGLLQRVRLLSNAQTSYQNRAVVLPSLEKTQRELERQLEAAQTTYTTLLKKREEARVAESQNVGNATIVEAAVPPRNPTDSRQNLYLAAGGIVGLLLGVAVAFLLDLVDRSVKTVRETKDLFGYPLLGIIPAFSSSGKLFLTGSDIDRNVPRIIARDIPNSQIQAAYQMLQANLRFVSSDHELKTIVLTSSVAGEGKSEVAANLAVAMAQAGHRVLLVDANMRYPSQHTAWGLTNSIGLSNVIVGQASFSDTVNEVMHNLHVLPAGVVPPNPVALLDSKRMALLVEEFTTLYDFVIIDTPPIVGSADALVLGRMSDGILLTVRPRVVDSARAKAAKGLLAQSGQNVLGIVANGVDVKNEPDSYFYYTQEAVTELLPSEADKPTLPSKAGFR